jgi:hypothetical protein
LHRKTPRTMTNSTLLCDSRQLEELLLGDDRNFQFVRLHKLARTFSATQDFRVNEAFRRSHRPHRFSHAASALLYIGVEPNITGPVNESTCEGKDVPLDSSGYVRWRSSKVSSDLPQFSLALLRLFSLSPELPILIQPALIKPLPTSGAAFDDLFSDEGDPSTVLGVLVGPPGFEPGTNG